MAAHFSVLAWRIPGTGEPGGLPSMGPHRVGHDWSDLAAAAGNISNLETISRRMCVLICKYSAISFKGLKHPWILVSKWGPETSPRWIPRDDHNILVQWSSFQPQKRNDVLINAVTEMTLRTLCLVRKARHKWPHIVWFYVVCGISGIGKSIETEIRSVVTQSWGWEKGEWEFNGDHFLWGWWKFLEQNTCGGLCHCECTKCHRILQLKMINFMWISPQ